jgi:hypothetical protein
VRVFSSITQCVAMMHACGRGRPGAAGEVRPLNESLV